MINEIISAFVLGLAGGIIPGPVLTAIFTEILQSSFAKSFRIILWAMLIETMVALTSLLFLTSFHLSESFFRAISFVGVAVLIWMAISIWKIREINTKEKMYFSLGKIAAMILANGVLWTFWITVNVPKAIILGEKLYLGQFIFLLIFELGWLVSTISTAYVFSFFRKILSNPKIIPIVFKLFSLAFLYFALNMLYQSLKFFIIK